MRWGLMTPASWVAMYTMRYRHEYGATSEAMLGLLESLRRLRAQGHPVGLALFNRSGAGGGQEICSRWPLLVPFNPVLEVALSPARTPGTRWYPLRFYKPAGTGP